MDFNVEQFITTGEDGSISVDVAGLKKGVQQYVDSETSKGVNTGIENFKKKNASADEKLLQQIKDLNLKYNRAECKAILAGDLFSDGEREIYLNNLVGDDLAKSQEVLNKLVAERKALNDTTKQNIIASLQSTQPAVQNAPKGEQGGVGKTPTKTFKQSSQDTISKYL